MSETIAAPTPAPESRPNQEDGEGSAEASQVINAVESGLGSATEQQVTETHETEGETPTTPEERLARVRFEDLKVLRMTVQEKYVTPTLQGFGEMTDGFKDRMDKGKKKALMLDRRQLAQEKKVLRMQNRLNRLNPNGMRYRSLDKRLGKANLKLGRLGKSIDRLNGAAARRHEHRKKLGAELEKQARQRREQLLAAKIVATEKKRRRKVKDKLYTTYDKAARERLKVEINSWDSIHLFENKVLEKFGQTTGGHSGGHH